MGLFGGLPIWARSHGAAPSLTSANYTVFDAAGGDSITLTGTNLSGAVGVFVGPTPATITGNTATTVTFTTPAVAAGTYNVTVATGGPVSNALVLKAWAPSSISGATHAWIADRGVTLVSGAVSQLDDQIGTAHQTQATAGSRPTVTNSANYGGKQVLSCASQFLSATIASIAKPLTLILVGHATSNTRVLAGSGVSVGPLVWRNTAASVEVYGSIAGTPTRTASAANSATAAACWMLTDDSTNDALYKNDLTTDIGTLTAGTQDSHWVATTTIGMGGPSTAGVTVLSGEMAELILISGVISSGDLADYAIRTALRYGLPVTG